METVRPPDRRRALIVANARYDDDGLGRLASPAQDASALTRVLEDQARCGFAVSTVLDGGSAEVMEAVEGFLADVERSDLLLLYFSCHGLKDESGRLYFAARNTRRDRLRSTAVPATVVNDLLLGSRSRRKVLVLDCCYGGAFAKGMQVKADTAVHTGEQFEARGLVVLTASDSTQYAFEGDVVRGAATPSRFTATFVEGLATGRADLDRDGFVTVDDAFEFVRRRLADEGAKQDPRKWEFDVAGRIVLGRGEDGGEGPLRLALPPPVVVAEPASDRSRAAASPLRQPRWQAGAIALLASCAALSWVVVTWLWDLLYDLVIAAESLPDRGDLRASAAALAAVWALAYLVVAASTGPRDAAGWSDAWRPLLLAFDDLLRPTGVRSFVRGLLSAVPINVVLVATAATAAAAAGYAWLNGSEGRDDAYRFTFVLLSLAGLAYYLRHAKPHRSERR